MISKYIPTAFAVTIVAAVAIGASVVSATYTGYHHDDYQYQAQPQHHSNYGGAAHPSYSAPRQSQHHSNYGNKQQAHPSYSAPRQSQHHSNFGNKQQAHPSYSAPSPSYSAPRRSASRAAPLQKRVTFNSRPDFIGDREFPQHHADSYAPAHHPRVHSVPHLASRAQHLQEQFHPTPYGVDADQDGDYDFEDVEAHFDELHEELDGEYEENLAALEREVKRAYHTIIEEYGPLFQHARSAREARGIQSHLHEELDALEREANEAEDELNAMYHKLEDMLGEELENALFELYQE